MMACSDNNTIIQNEKNEIYVCGWNKWGQLGLGDYENRNKFEKVGYDLGEIEKIVCGYFYTMIQTKKNEIYACGSNAYYRLGLGDNRPREKFEKVNYDFGKIKNIACGENHTVVQNEKNEVYVCGDNEDGQLGLGNYYNRNRFEKVEYDFSEIRNIVCGKNYTMVQNEKNEIYVCGHNYHGQLGLGEKNDGHICGYNYHGQSGSDINSVNKFKKVDFEFGEIEQIIYGSDYVVIQNKKNEIYVCGKNSEGQLGLGDNSDRYKFEKVDFKFGEIKKIACGIDYTVIQNEKNEIYACGSNLYGQLGLGDYQNRSKFEKVNYDFGKIKNIACGGHHIMIQNEKNEIYVCGGNSDGQLGLDDNKHRYKYEKVEKNFGEIKKIVCCNTRTIIQNEKNEVYVCGYNGSGQLGLGDYKNRYKFEKIYTNDIFFQIYDFGLKLNTEEIAL